MKILKNSWLRASIILLLVVGVFITLNAMKQATTEKAVHSTAYWFEFTGYYADDHLDPFKYQKLDEEVVLPNCEGGDKVCVINALDDGSGFPIISTTLIAEIESAIQRNKHTQNVMVRE